MSARSIALVGVVGLASLAAPASAQTSYAQELLRGSTYFLEICLPPCACPQRGIEVPMRGTFALRLISIGDVFDFYAVENVRFVADTDPGATFITGEGTFRYGNVVALQQMTLDLRIQPGDRAIQVSSDVVVRRLDLPRMQIEVQSEQFVCSRITLNIQSNTCVADVDDGTGSGTPDGGVTIDDLLYYLSIFEDGNIRADVDDGTGTGTPDGGVTIDDLLYYLYRFSRGC